MQFIIVSLHKWGDYEFYLQIRDGSKYNEIKDQVACVAKIKFNLSTVPENPAFGMTSTLDDPRKTEVLDKDLWVCDPVIALETRASTDKHIAGKTFAELRERAKGVITGLKSLHDQKCSVPVRGGTKVYTVETIITELENLTVDGLTFLNDWLDNQIEIKAILNS